MVPDQSHNAIKANDAQQGMLRVRLGTINRVVTTPTNTPATSSIAGLMTDNGAFPSCTAWFGSQQGVMNVVNQRAPGSTLRVQCPQASTLHLTNNDGKCLQVGLPKAARIEATGNKTVSVILPPPSLPTVINVAGMTHWGPPGHSDSNTRLLVRLSQLQAHGNAMRSGSLSIEGKLQYAVPYGSYGVVVKGCGMSKVVCGARDSNDRLVCRLVDTCTDDASVAKQTMLTQLTSMPPCTKPR